MDTIFHTGDLAPDDACTQLLLELACEMERRSENLANQARRQGKIASNVTTTVQNTYSLIANMLREIKVVAP